MSNLNPWTDDRAAMLRALALTGLTGDQIAAKYPAGLFTRSAILGKANKLGITIGFWQEATLATLRRQHEDGRSGAEIARTLGCTRNMVIGKLNRLGLKTDDETARHNSRRLHPGIPKHNPRQGVNIGGGVTAATIVRRAELEPVPLPPLREVQSLHARPWMEREPGQCSWPISGEGAETLSCCAPAFKRGWCRPHFLIGTVPVKRPISAGKVMRRAA